MFTKEESRKQREDNGNRREKGDHVERMELEPPKKSDKEKEEEAVARVRNALPEEIC